MNLKCELVNKVSKNNSPYTCLRIWINDKCPKDVFVTDAEIALIKMTYNK